MTELKSYISTDEELSVRQQCELLDIAPSSYYYKPKGESSENQEIMRLMDEEFLEHPTMAYCKCRTSFLQWASWLIQRELDGYFAR